MKSDKIRQLTTFYSLPKKQQKAIMLLFSGEMNQGEVANNVGISRTTISAWKQKEIFRQAQDEYNRFMLRDLTSEAIMTMRELLDARSEMVRFSAAKDILDRSMNDAQIRRAEAEADIAESKAKEARSGDSNEGQTLIVDDVGGIEDEDAGS
ncbi:phBC6A51 family helix-turn-helix protein [Lactiplantibacillus plantarum]|uniref:phBC6A51 family helix-turn-helix protein n=1 Tax=Lactiplantibacillus plantarum TaxID=1590 RepID=UPI00223D6F8B|nr:phBC6A51 family helix-turn-helix protein [Lactiplantibacillus plantarum]